MTRSNSVSFTALPDREATQPEPISLPMSSSPSVLRCCANSFPRPSALPSSSIRPMPLPRTTIKGAESATGSSGLQIQVFNSSNSDDIDAAFATWAANKPDALFVAPGAFFNSRRVQLATLAARYALPASYSVRDYAEVGGLMSYGTSIGDAFYQVGRYSGRVLRGENPAEMPVMQTTTFEFVLNLRTAKTLGIMIPPQLLARADEVIE